MAPERLQIATKSRIVQSKPILFSISQFEYTNALLFSWCLNFKLDGGIICANYTMALLSFSFMSLTKQNAQVISVHTSEDYDDVLRGAAVDIQNVTLE